MNGLICGRRHKPYTTTFNTRIGAKIFSPGVSLAHSTSISFLSLFTSACSSVWLASCFLLSHPIGCEFLIAFKALLRICSYSQIVTLTKLPAVNWNMKESSVGIKRCNFATYSHCKHESLAKNVALNLIRWCDVSFKRGQWRVAVSSRTLLDIPMHLAANEPHIVCWHSLSGHEI